MAGVWPGELALRKFWAYIGRQELGKRDVHRDCCLVGIERINTAGKTTWARRDHHVAANGSGESDLRTFWASGSHQQGKTGPVKSIM